MSIQVSLGGEGDKECSQPEEELLAQEGIVHIYEWSDHVGILGIRQ